MTHRSDRFTLTYVTGMCIVLLCSYADCLGIDNVTPQSRTFAKITNVHDAHIAINRAIKQTFGKNQEYTLQGITQPNSFAINATERTRAYGQWDAFATVMNNYINDNCKNAVGIKDKDIVQAYTTIMSSTRSMLNTVKVIYNAYLSPIINKKLTHIQQQKLEDGALNEIEKVAQYGATFHAQAHNQKLLALQQDTFTLTRKKDVVGAIMKLATQLEDCAKRIYDDLHDFLIDRTMLDVM